MGSKIFVSYKYGDENVQNLSIFSISKVRDYVTEFENLLDDSDDIYKGESDGEDLSDFKDSTIETKLKEKIFDSSITIVFISPGMKDISLNETNQWIPWEISYSLRNKSKNSKTEGKRYSSPNGLIGVVLPDTNGSYDYYIKQNLCCPSRCRGRHPEITFHIITANQFNKRQPDIRSCSYNGQTIYQQDDSYLEVVKWDDFTKDYKKYVERAKEKQSNRDDYELCIKVAEE